MVDNEPTQYELDEYAENLPQKWLDCRIYGCSRDPKTASYRWVRLEGSRKWALEEVAQCRGRCGNWWTQLQDDQGHALTRLKKHYIDGWQAKGIGRINEKSGKKAVLRRERIKRKFPNLNELPKEE